MGIKLSSALGPSKLPSPSVQSLTKVAAAVEAPHGVSSPDAGERLALAALVVAIVGTAVVVDPFVIRTYLQVFAYPAPKLIVFGIAVFMATIGRAISRRSERGSLTWVDLALACYALVAVTSWIMHPPLSP